MPKSKGSKKAAAAAAAAAEDDEEPAGPGAADALSAAGVDAFSAVAAVGNAAVEAVTNATTSARELVAPSQDKHLTCIQRLKRVVAIDKWKAHVTAFTSQFVNLKWVLTFMLAELLTGAFFVLFYLWFVEVAELGTLFKDWHTFVLFGLARCLGAVWGGWVFWSKNMNNARIVFFLLVFNFVIGMFMLRPIFYLDCNCTNWWQCHALQGFTQEPLLNPFPFPTVPRFNNQRVMPIETPPRIPSSSSGSMMLELGRTSEAHIPRAHAQRLATIAARRISSDSTVQLGEHARERWKRLTNVEACNSNIWEFYNTVTDGVTFAPDLDVCSKEVLNETRRAELMDLTARLRSGEDVRHKADEMPWITSVLWLCKRDELCDYVHLSLENETGASLCQVKGNPLPVVAHSTFDTWFQKDTRKVQECHADPDEDTTLNDEVFQNLPVKEAMDDVMEFQKDGCHCDDQKSCRIYSNHNGQDRYWCYVAKELKSICSAKGIQLHWDEQKQKFWGEELCRQADCKCSGLGMHPTGQDLANEPFNSGLLWENKMNYGSSCRRWHKDDRWPWCFTGFDSICPDRHPKSRKTRFSTSLPEEVRNMTWQWRSQLPCEKDAQALHVEHASNTCENINVVSSIVLVLLFLFAVPMYVATFEFIANRCNDYTETEEQFEVNWSDSSSDSASEAEDKAGAAGDSDSDTKSESSEDKPAAKAKAKGKKK